MPVVVHVLEPTVRSEYGHHLVFCERVKEYLRLRCIDSVCYFAREGIADRRLRARAPHDKFVFTFRFGRDMELSFAGASEADDTPRRRAINQAKEAVAASLGDGSIEGENLAWRLRYDLDAMVAADELSRAEERVLEQATEDLRGLAQLLAVNFSDRNNVLLLPTGEFFLLRALRASLPAFGPLMTQIHIRLWNFRSLERNGADLVAEAVAVEAEARRLGVAVYLYSEVDWGRERLGELTATPAGYLDINSFCDLPDPAAAPALRAAPDAPGPPRDGRLRVLFPGSYRRFPDKGLAFLRAIFLTEPFPVDVEIVVQQPDFAAMRVDPARAEANPRIVILPPILGELEYRRQLGVADAICLPYDDVTWPDQFRGSGVMMEAFLAAKPIVVRPNTLLARYSEGYLINMVGNVGDFWSLLAGFNRPEQIERAAANRRTYALRLRRNDFLANLPADAGNKPLLRFLHGGAAVASVPKPTDEGADRW
jgi:hypothetical protein